MYGLERIFALIAFMTAAMMTCLVRGRGSLLGGLLAGRRWLS